jgi:hypothetical protein
MSDRPGHLIIVTHPGQAGLELFSAHYTESAAQTVLDRLQRLLAPTGSKAHMVVVPECEGVADVGELPPLPPVPTTEAKPASSAPPPPAEKPAPFRRMSREEFALQAHNDEMHGGPVTDTVVNYSGAFS